MSDTIPPKPVVAEQTIITPPMKVSPEGGVPSTINTSIAPALGSMGVGGMIVTIVVYGLSFAHIQPPAEVIGALTGLTTIAIHYLQDRFFGVNS